MKKISKHFGLNLYSNKLKAALSLLAFFTLLQGCLTLWVAEQSSFHIEKSKVANRLLSEFIDLGGNKQRLKVWLAQYLLTKDGSVETKYDLQAKMAQTLKNLNEYLIKDLELAENLNEIKTIEEQKERLKTLQINIESLNRELGKVKKATVFENTGAVWKFMIQVFDNLEGSDLKRLIGDAIDIQKIRATEAETSARSYIRYFNFSVYILTVFTILMAIFLAYLLLKSLKNPLSDLVNATVSMAQGNLSHRIKTIEDNEFGVVAQHLNEMAEEIEKLRLDDIEKRSVIEKEVEIRTNELKLAIEKLQASEKERKIFLANITHELKTPATAILGEAEVTLRSKNPDMNVYVETLKVIVQTGKELSSRIEDLLLLARGENDIFKLSLENRHLNVLNNIISNLINSYMSNESHRFKLNLTESDYLINIDEQRLSQLFLILFDNAKKYSNRIDTIEISSKIENGLLKVRVTNPCDHLELIDFSKIQNRYYRSQSAVIRRPDGLGIGLSIARMIVKAHLGNLEITAEDSKNFVVNVELPLEIKA